MKCNAQHMKLHRYHTNTSSAADWW